MTDEINVDDLEKALLDRAKALSEEYSQRAKRSYDHYIEDENERLRLREEREEMSAKMHAEQVYRRMVQSEELHSVKRLDQLRWQLMHQVIDDVRNQLTTLIADKNAYLTLIKQFIEHSLVLIPSDHLVLKFNQADYQWLTSQWHEIRESITTEKTLELSDSCHSESGGFLIYDKVNKMRVNNTFEGLLERHKEEINQIIAENLFAELAPIRSNLNEW